jgi:hypothetical protein
MSLAFPQILWAGRSRRIQLLEACVAGLLIVLLSMTALAQSWTASLSGTVLDPSGAVIPKAKLTLTNLATQAVRTATSSCGSPISHRRRNLARFVLVSA